MDRQAVTGGAEPAATVARRTGMRRPAALAPLLLILLAATGCAAPGGQHTGAGTPVATTPPAGPSGAASGATGCRSGQVTVTEAQAGQGMCVTTGTLVQVYLHGQPGTPWSPVKSDGPALRAVASGRGAVPIGVTAGFFKATGAGSARLTSSRPMCPSAPPGGARCLAMQGFSLTVEVR
jgi:hypothetical protein